MRFVAALSSALLLTASFTSLARAQVTVQVSPTPDRPVIVITVAESVSAAPDVATINAGVQTTALTASAAMGENSIKMDKVIAAIRARGIPAKDIQTTGISLGAQYDYANQKPGVQPPLIGYQVSNGVRLITRDLGKIGQLLDMLVAAGCTSFDGPYFSIEKAAELTKEARGKALKAAEARAQEYATRTGFVRARLLAVSEGGPSYVGVSDIVVTASNAGGGGPPPPPPPPAVAPGRMQTGVTLTVHYQLER